MLFTMEPIKFMGEFVLLKWHVWFSLKDVLKCIHNAKMALHSVMITDFHKDDISLLLWVGIRKAGGLNLVAEQNNLIYS